jgi:hypothetical protein
MTSSQRTALVLIVAFMVMAVLVPALALGQPRPARFGWQMYSVAQPAPRAWLQADDGSVTEFDLANRLAVLRADIPDPTSLGERLCAQESAKAVLVELHTTDLVRVPCN